MTNAPWSLLSLYFLPFLLKKKDEKWLNIYQKAPNRIDSIENYSPLVFFFFLVNSTTVIIVLLSCHKP